MGISREEHHEMMEDLKDRIIEMWDICKGRTISEEGRKTILLAFNKFDENLRWMESCHKFEEKK